MVQIFNHCGNELRTCKLLGLIILTRTSATFKIESKSTKLGRGMVRIFQCRPSTGWMIANHAYTCSTVSVRISSRVGTIGSRFAKSAHAGIGCQGARFVLKIEKEQTSIGNLILCLFILASEAKRQDSC